MIERRPIFAAVRKLRDDRAFTLAEVRLLDGAIDEAIGEAARPTPAPVAGRKLAAFFDTMRASRLLGPTLSDNEVQGCTAIIAACAGWPVSWTAYALATAYHETAGTMQPIKEYGGAAYFGRMYDPQGTRPHIAKRLGNTVPGDGVKFAGRGYVQLTGRANYAKAQKKLGVPLVDKPDLAMQPKAAADIMARGMQEGWFTGKSLKTYLPATGTANITQFKAARRIINGTDKADAIARHSLEFQRALGAV